MSLIQSINIHMSTLGSHFQYIWINWVSIKEILTSHRPNCRLEIVTKIQFSRRVWFFIVRRWNIIKYHTLILIWHHTKFSCSNIHLLQLKYIIKDVSIDFFYYISIDIRCCVPLSSQVMLEPWLFHIVYFLRLCQCPNEYNT